MLVHNLFSKLLFYYITSTIVMLQEIECEVGKS